MFLKQQKGSNPDVTPLHVPWVEKYRPKTVEHISHQEEVVNVLQKAISTGSLPHLLFYGPPGTGKTTAALAVSRDLFGQDFRQSGRVLELNASDDRGIAVVRNKIKRFAQGAINHSNSSLAPFKLIILDEADSMTIDAQSALRRMIESYSKVTRFCLICNYVSRIIEPIASRCAKFRFKPLASTTMSSRLDYICTQEAIKADEKLITTILSHAQGDMRRAVNLLQSGHQLNGSNVTSSTISDISGTVPSDILDSIWENIKSSSFGALQKTVEELVAAGYAAVTLLERLTSDVIHHDEMTDEKKAKSLMIIAQTDHKLVDGASEYLQLLHVAATLLRIWHA